MTAIAALTMYDLPELRGATDAWWAVIARHLRAAGFADVPSALTRGRPVAENWRDPGLLLTQTCGYPLTHAHGDDLTAILAPDFAAEGCGGGLYSSVFVVRADDPAQALADLRGRRAAFNGPDSQSGYNVLRYAVAPLAAGKPFFGETMRSGAHRDSLAMVREGQADIAAIDGVTFALVGDAAPLEVEGVRVLQRSRSAPSLPYAVRKSLAAEDRRRVTDAVLDAAEDVDGRSAREALRLNGLQPVTDADYNVMVEMRLEAERLGYPELA